jgi:hypothetical protein
VQFSVVIDLIPTNKLCCPFIIVASNGIGIGGIWGPRELMWLRTDDTFNWADVGVHVIGQTLFPAFSATFLPLPTA